MGFFTPQEWISLRGVSFTEGSGFFTPQEWISLRGVRGVGFFTPQEWISLRGVSFTEWVSSLPRSGFLHSPGVDFIEGSGFY